MSGKWGRGSHAEDNALAFVQTVEGEAAPSQHHVQKRRKKQRGLEIVFDPQAHKEFVTGFHKRKLQRKKDGQKILEEKAKKARLEERAQKRAELRARLDLDRYETDSEADEPVARLEGQKDVQAYTSNGAHATVTVAPFSLHSESEEDPAGAADGSSSSEEEEEQPKQQQQQPQKGRSSQGPAQGSQKQKRGGTFSRYAGGGQAGKGSNAGRAATQKDKQGLRKKKRKR